MTRIIGGVAGGRRLETPTGGATRPTSDRVREALFSVVESALGSLSGLRFLDLYAGSGAVGLEAASRGAGAATLVEHDRRTAQLARRNARSLGLGQVEVVCASVARHLQHPPAAAAPYDVVFLDPPYGRDPAHLAADLGALTGPGWLAEGALVVVERSTRAGALDWPEGYRPDRVRSYGETSLELAAWAGPSGEPLRYRRDDPSVSPPERGPAQEV